MQELEKAIYGKEVARRLGVGDSTIRRWAIELEKNGYQFVKNERGERAYLERDIDALRELRDLINIERMNIVSAVKRVVEGKYEVSRTTGAHVERNMIEKIADALERQLERQEEFNKMLLEKLDEQQRFIEKSINERDKKLMEMMREMQEMKLLESGRKSWWRKFFNKF